MAGASLCTGTSCATTGDCCRVAGAGFGLSADGTSCGACPAGQFKSDTGAGLCSLCPSGQYSSVEGATSDTVCTICGGFTNAAQSTCTGGGMQWVLGSTAGQSCDAVCGSQGTAMTSYGAAAFKEVATLVEFIFSDLPGSPPLLASAPDDAGAAHVLLRPSCASLYGSSRSLSIAATQRVAHR